MKYVVTTNIDLVSCGEILIVELFNVRNELMALAINALVNSLLFTAW